MKPYHRTRAGKVIWLGVLRDDDAVALDVPMGAAASITLSGPGELLQSSDAETWICAVDVHGRPIVEEANEGTITARLAPVSFDRIIAPKAHNESTPLGCTVLLDDDLSTISPKSKPHGSPMDHPKELLFT